MSICENSVKTVLTEKIPVTLNIHYKLSLEYIYLSNTLI